MYMEENKKIWRLVLIVSLVVALFCLYLLNDKYKWIEFNKKETTNNNEKEEEEENVLEDLFYNQRAFLDEIKEASNIDVLRVLSGSKKTLKESYVSKITPINNSLETAIKTKTDALLNQETISTEDIMNLRRDMIISADAYNIALGNLQGDTDSFELFTTIVYQSPLNSYYYFDGIEGSFLIEVNYAYLYNIMKDKMTPAARAYSIIKNEIFKYNNSNYLYKDGGLGVTWDVFKEVILLYDEYVLEYPNETKVIDEYNTLFDIFIGTTELPNTPIVENKSIKSEVIKAYKDIVDNHKAFSKYNEVKKKYDSNVNGLLQ